MSAEKERSKRRSSSGGSLRSAISYIQRRGVKVRGNVDLYLHLGKIEEEAKAVGLDETTLNIVLDIASSRIWPDTVSQRLVKSLIPQHRLSVVTALRAISWMCTNTPTNAIQTLLLRWLILVYDLIDNSEDMCSVYGLIFFFLQNDTMRPHACHLLYLLTRKEDVLPVRVRTLLELQQKVGVQPYIQGLLSLYKLYRPYLVSVVIPSSRKVFFRQTPFDRTWAAAIRQVQEKQRADSEHQEAGQGDASQPGDSIRQESTLMMLGLKPLDVTQPTRNGNKRRRVLEIPIAATSQLKRPDRTRWTSMNADDDEIVSIGQITSFNECIKKFDKLELPSQIASGLRNVYVQYLISVSPDPVIAHRLSYWIHHALQEEFLSRNRTESLESRGELLQRLVSFSEYLQEGIPVVDLFLTHYLHVWNGTDHRGPVIHLIARLHLLPFPVLHEDILSPLQKLFFASSVFFKCQVIWCMTELLRNYVMVEWPRYKHTLDVQTRQNAVDQSSTGISNHHTMFAKDVETFSGLDTIRGLIMFVGRLSSVALRVEKGNSLLAHYIISFYKLVTSLPGRFTTPICLLIPSEVFHTCLFANNAYLINCICHIMERYREAFVEVRNPKNISTPEEIRTRTISVSDIRHFNQYLRDATSCLWRLHAFQYQKDETDSVFRIMSEEDNERLKKTFRPDALCIYQHQAFIGYAHLFLQKTQPAEKTMHPGAIKPHRYKYLDYLDLEHLNSLKSFMQAFIKSFGNVSSVSSTK